MKKLALFLSTLVVMTSLVGCQQKKEPLLENCGTHLDEQFRGTYIDISISDFNKLGFTFGDSLNLYFSNGVSFSDVGYYSGYYVPAGQELVVGYPGYDFINYCINYGASTYDINDFDEDTTVTIKLNQKAKYLDVEQTLSISYSDDINEYDDAEQFANFREISGKNIKPNTLYRGASPIDNRRKRAAVVDDLLNQYHINYDIDLADKEEDIENFFKKDDFASPYFKELDDNDKVLSLGMAAAYKTDTFAEQMKMMFLNILNNDGPYYIHCLEGKDRTGYVCMVIEALCGASYDELIEDYFITYHNYYGIEKDSKKYDVIKEIHIDEMIRYVFDFHQSTNLLTANYRSRVNDYLLAVGLTQVQIDAVQAKLSK